MKAIQSVLFVLLITALGTFNVKSQNTTVKDNDFKEWALTTHGLEQLGFLWPDG